jgi:hypothetical protein
MPPQVLDASEIVVGVSRGSPAMPHIEDSVADLPYCLQSLRQGKHHWKDSAYFNPVDTGAYESFSLVVGIIVSLGQMPAVPKSR